MKRILPLIVLLFAVALAGCAATPAAKTYQLRESYVAVLKGLDEAAVAGKISKAQAVELQHLRPIADAAEKAVVNLQATGGPAFDAALSAAQTILDQLIAANAAAKAK